MSQNDPISGVSGRRRAGRAELQAEFERVYQEELQNAKGAGGTPPDEAALRDRAAAKVRSRHPEVDPAELSQAAWSASQALGALSRG
ncbi:MAG: hypothetical protein IT572_08445 [Deltaproteobacteria bacterium]|nr:hypothetical protein [Deltaproteobacteria bacterium]